jgi:hypothetical protein
LTSEPSAIGYQRFSPIDLQNAQAQPETPSHKKNVIRQRLMEEVENAATLCSKLIDQKQKDSRRRSFQQSG